MLEAVNTGKNWVVGQRKFAVQTTQIVMGHAAVKITEVHTQESYLIRQVDNTIYTGDNVTITVPWFNLNVLSLISGDKLFHMRQFKISKTLYRLMMLRLMSGEINLSSEIAYAKTLASTY